MLNRDEFERRQNLKRLFLEAENSLKYQIKQRKKPKNRVNYVSNVDVIT